MTCNGSIKNGVRKYYWRSQEIIKEEDLAEG